MDLPGTSRAHAERCDRRLVNDATTLRNRSEFSKNQLTELASTDYEAWVKESLQIATTITYQYGAIGTPMGERGQCSELSDAKLLPIGYAKVAGVIADRRIMLAGYRLADLLKRVTAN
jgi:S1/P1 Nuclease